MLIFRGGETLEEVSVENVNHLKDKNKNYYIATFVIQGLIK